MLFPNFVNETSLVPSQVNGVGQKLQ